MQKVFPYLEVPTESLQNHQINSYEMKATTIVLPEDKKKLHQFKITKATWFVPLVIYFDTEALPVTIYTCASEPNATG